ncbi:MAG TPA: hypothetical protein VN922_17190, partial [Bacteroidia bacterium]|nr:hypothetical protein [Bacteroidia bacterium]
NIFRKIVYHDIYPGIDIEYSFIEGKAGIKYSLIVHPGADISLVKLVYNGAEDLHLNSNGDAVLQTDIGEITDHAPVSYYKNSAQHVNSGYKIMNGNTETFFANAISGTNDDLIIDPWSWDPNFTVANDAAYDVDYDQWGNVYAYGGDNPFQLAKFNAAGTQQWTFWATTISHTEYGDFAVDKITGTSYITEGAVNAGGAKALKVNTLSTLTGTFPGTASMLEMWRAVFNSCTRQMVIGGGGLNTPYSQACILDTNMTGFTPVNPLGVTGATAGGHDVCLVAMDPAGGTAWMAIAQTAGGPTFNNVIMSLPVPALTPTNYIVSDGYTFQEASNAFYVPGVQTANGFNGMAAGPTFLYTYDGATLDKVNKANGAIIANKAVTNNPFSWGGLDVDACDNAYVGENSAVKVF